jgi:hypothetical protein
MTGLVLSIVVLATGTIVPSVEAMKPTLDPITGIKLQCKVMKDHLICKATSKEKIDAILMVFESEGVDAVGGDCKKSKSVADDTIENGSYLLTVIECGQGLETIFLVLVENDAISSIRVLDPS